MSDSEDSLKEKFDIIERIGKGAFSRIFKAFDKTNNRHVALKKIFIGTSPAQKENRTKCARREADILQKIEHENIVGIYDVIKRDGGGVTLVLEFVSTNLRNILSNQNEVLSRSHVKMLMKMLIGGLKHLHANEILHRDVKPSNLLITENGVLKIADFGMSRKLGEKGKLTPQVVSLQYRCPEILLAGSYTTAVDMWSCGCVFAEMLARKSLIEAGNADLDQLSKIFLVLGKPKKSDYDDLPEHSEYLLKSDENDSRKNVFAEKFPEEEGNVHEMLRGLFNFNQKKRLSAEDALQCEYFTSLPKPQPFKPSPITNNRKRTATIRTAEEIANLPKKRLFE